MIGAFAIIIIAILAPLSAAASQPTNSYIVVSVRLFKGAGGYTDLGITVSSQSNSVTSFLVAHLACASTLGQDISEYVGLSEQQGGPFGNGETREFTVKAPYTSKPETCSATIVGAVNPLSEVQ